MQPPSNDKTLLEGSVDYFRHKGIKIKLTDIEDAIADYPYISGVAVVCTEDKEGNRQLTAYIKPHGSFSQNTVVNFLTEKLKPFMIPAIWVCIDEFPLTVWGTVDKQALSQIEQDKPGEFIAPRTEKEVKLARIIKEVLKLESISINDNFFRLGGGSLQALRVIAAIRKELSINMDIKYFFLYPTIAELSRYLSNTEYGTSHPVKTNDNNPSAFSSSLHNTSIVPIKAKGKKRPLYIVSGGGGTAFTFAKFAYMLDEDQPVYGFQQPSDANELGHFPETIEEIAAKYVKEILVIDPDGPYALSGHCIGGVIALEMARILQAMGKKIHLLAMFDVILTDEQESKANSKNKKFNLIHTVKKNSISLLRKIEFETFLLFRHTKDAFDYKLEKIKVFINNRYQFREEDTDYVVFTHFEKMFEKAYANYKVKSYSGDMLVFYAKDHHHFVDEERNIRFKKYVLPEEEKNRWHSYADNVKIFDVDGEHSSIFDPIYSSNFAGLLQQHL